MEIIEFNEKDDGSAEILVNLTEEEVKLLVNYAIVDILKKYTEEKR
jgi:hypothetical protein